MNERKEVERLGLSERVSYDVKEGLPRFCPRIFVGTLLLLWNTHTFAKSPCAVTSAGANIILYGFVGLCLLPVSTDMTNNKHQQTLETLLQLTCLMVT